MSTLKVYRDDKDPGSREEYTRFEDIARVAAEAGIHFKRWSAGKELAPGAAQDQVLSAYREAIDELSRSCGFVTADVISLTPENPNHPELRKKFLDEHVHTEDEARYFVEGSGLFCIHHGSSVYALHCEQGDLINVPAGTRHWFDMGPAPRFTCIRLFSDPKGWVAEHTGSDIASRFPRYGE